MGDAFYHRKRAPRVFAALTVPERGSIMPAMAKDAPRESQAELDLKKLEYRVEELIRLAERLKEENISLQQKQETLVSERAALLQKNELVRTRVEAMITRLRAMEHSS